MIALRTCKKQGASILIKQKIVRFFWSVVGLFTVIASPHESAGTSQVFSNSDYALALSAEGFVVSWAMTTTDCNFVDWACIIAPD